MTDSIAQTLADLKLTIDSKFIPFSRSRNAKADIPNLNWSITVRCNGRDILVTDYSAGMAHCPSYRAKVPKAWDRPDRVFQGKVCAFECESGYKAATLQTWQNDFSANRKQPIKPKIEYVFYSLVMDSYVLESGGFEDWAYNYGYDTDSRQAEKIYKACLEIALKMRAAIGDSGMGLLRTAFEDY